MKFKLLLLTFIGGAVGSALRYLISASADSQSAALWIVNLLGAFVLGYVQVAPRFKSDAVQALLGTGFAGGFTTVSGLMIFAILTPYGTWSVVTLQVILGILVYWLGRLIGGERKWSKS
jgi:fluoride ion exporter CrcB/FEX